jgi:hypothetical protein
MDFTRLIIAGVLGGIAGGVGGAIGQLVARLTKQDVKTFYRTSGGQALVIVPVVAVSALTSSLDWDVKIKDRLEGRPAVQRELATQGQALLTSEPALLAKFQGKSSAEVRAMARELSAKGIKRLTVPELRRLGALRLALAEQSPRFCESLWTGAVDEATMTAALSGLNEAESSEFGRIISTAMRLEVRGEGVARPPADEARLMALIQALVDVYGEKQGGELKGTLVQGMDAPRADGCRAVRMMLGALPKLSDEDAITASLLLGRPPSAHLCEQRRQLDLLRGGEAPELLAERLRKEREAARRRPAPRRREREPVAAQVGLVDLAAQEARSLEALQVHRDGGPRHAELGRQRRRVGVLVDLGEQEQLFRLEAELSDGRGDVRDHGHHQPIVERPELGRVDFRHGGALPS